MTFKELGLSDVLLEGLSYMGFEEATPIQEQAIPMILEGKDMLACAQTGTGKTAAFILPILDLLSREKRNHTSTLVVAPTRELAIQIERQIQAFSYFAGISSIAVYGGGDGQDFTDQKKALSSGVDVIVATPGKLISHLNMGYVKFKKVNHLILDEADRMLDMGFYDDIKFIVSHLPEKRQTLLFSATMPPKIKKLAKNILTNYGEIALSLSKPAEGVLQAAYLIDDNGKSRLIRQLIKDKPAYKSIIVFTSTKKKVNDIVRAISNQGYAVQAVSSDLKQEDRELAIRKFRARTTRVIVATDVLSRGIDIKDINLVINYDVPNDAEDYVHRIGRTARADTTGVAITLVNRADMYKFDKIEKLIEAKVPKIPVPEDIGATLEWNPKPEPRNYGRGGGNKSKGRGGSRNNRGGNNKSRNSRNSGGNKSNRR